jgi:hypothetical membrane protein
MNTSIVIEGILIIAGVIMIGSLWKHTFISRAARSFLVITGLAFVTVGLVPADVNENLHVLGALFITFVGNIGLILTGLTSNTSYVKRMWVLAPIIGIIGLIATGLFFTGHYLGLGMGGMERFAVFNLPIWTLLMGCYLLAASNK